MAGNFSLISALAGNFSLISALGREISQWLERKGF